MEKLENEIWKDIKGYETKYQVSNLGRIKSCKFWSGNRYISNEKILKQANTPKGYLVVCLRKNNKAKVYRVHRLVAQAFIPNPEDKPQINHIDNNRKNNKVDNLEWVNNSENQQHAFKYGNQKRYKGSKNYSAIKITQYDKDNNFISEWGSITEASIKNNISSTSINNCLRKRSKSAGGFIWKYKENGRNGYNGND